MRREMTKKVKKSPAAIGLRGECYSNCGDLRALTSEKGRDVTWP